MKKDELTLFISFCGDDRTLKDKIEQKLIPLVDYYQKDSTKFKIIHMDNDCHSDWGKWMIEAIDKSDLLITILTDNVFNADKRVYQEVVEARNKGKFIIPFVITDKKEIPENYRANLNGTSMVYLRNDYNKEDFEEALDELYNKTKLTLDKIQNGETLTNNIMPIELSLNQNNAFFGRKKELELIKTKFENNNVVILSGQGGIGKTTLAKHFFFENKDLYNNAYIIEAKNGIKEAITNLKLNSILTPKKDFEERYQENLKELEKLSSKTIIIFDNCDNEIKNEEINNIMALHCKSLITSRLKKEEKILIEIGQMENDDLIDLVYNKHPNIEKENNKTKEEVKKLLLDLFENAGYHTLTIEMAASIMKQGEYYIDEISDKLLEVTEKCKTEHTDEKETIYERLSTLYDLGKLNDNERKIIQSLTLIAPEIGIRKRTLRELLQLDDTNDINNLIEKSFIQEENTNIKLHTLFSDVIYKKEDVKNKYEENTAIIKYLIDYETDDSDANSYSIKSKYLQYLDQKRKEIFLNHQEEYGDILNEIGDIIKYFGLYQDALKKYQQALKILKEVYADQNNPSIALSYDNIGYEYTKLGKVDEALKYYQEALKIRKIIYKNIPNHLDIADSYDNIGIAYRDLCKTKLSLKYYQEALKIRKAVYKDNPNHQEIADSYYHIGIMYNSIGKFDKALKYHQQTFEIYKNIYRNNQNPRIANSYNAIGITFAVKGKYEDALKNYQKSLEIRKEVYKDNPNHPYIANSYNNIGILYRELGDYEKTKNFYDEALKIRKIAYKNNLVHTYIANSYNNIGNVHNDLKEYDKALKCYQDAKKIYEIVYKNNLNHPYIANSYNNLGTVYSDLGGFEKANELYQAALRIYKEIYSDFPNQPYVASLYNNIGILNSNLGNNDEALIDFQTALEIRKKLYKNTYHPYIAISYNNLGAIYCDLKNIEAAETFYQLSLKIMEKSYDNDVKHPYVIIVSNNISNINLNKKSLKINQKIDN